MRTFSSATLAFFLLLASSQAHVSVYRRKGGSDGGGDVGGNGIPLVGNVKNPLCKPWYAIRDAIITVSHTVETLL